ncbi:MAG: metallophosphoesterase [Planctomycetota bacterium]|jgi:predicted MPP superfamily phosphohydrolase
MNAAPESASGAELRLPPRRYSTLRVQLFRWTQRFLERLGARRFYRAWALAPGRFEVRRERVEVPGLPPDLDGLRVVQWSDLHAGPYLGPRSLDAVVAATVELQPDLFVLTGDYITEVVDEGLFLGEVFARIGPRLGSFAVFGNHDYRERREAELEAAYADAGVRFLRNRTVHLDVGSASLAITGLEDVEEGRGDPAEALEGLRPGEPRLVLVHNPYVAERLDAADVVAVLSGHTHGRQVNVPPLRWFAPEHPGDCRTLPSGAVSLVSRGLGALGLPLRLAARADVVCLELKRAGGTA